MAWNDNPVRAALEWTHTTLVHK